MYYVFKTKTILKVKKRKEINLFVILVTITFSLTPIVYIKPNLRLSLSSLIISHSSSYFFFQAEDAEYNGHIWIGLNQLQDREEFYK